MPCGFLWILVTWLQRYSRTLLQCIASALCTIIYSSNTAISNSSNVYLCSPAPLLVVPSCCPLPACNCDPMGSVSMQCHSNGTCQCREGFVGYKCDKCEMNYFYDKATHQCEECPVCYGLVKKQVSLCVCVCVLKAPKYLATWCGLFTYPAATD